MTLVLMWSESCLTMLWCRNSKSAQPCFIPSQQEGLTGSQHSSCNPFCSLITSGCCGSPKDFKGMTLGLSHWISHPGFSARGGPQGFRKGPTKPLQKTLKYIANAHSHTDKGKENGEKSKGWVNNGNSVSFFFFFWL